MFDFSDSFFRPLWRRIVLVAFCAGWALFEMVTGAPFWAMIFFGFTGLVFWKLFLDQDNLKKLNKVDDK